MTEDHKTALTVEQLARVQALHEARAVLGKTGFGSTDLDSEPTDVVDLAEYILSGRHPLDRFTGKDDEADDETGVVLAGSWSANAADSAE